jgi:hypothetical protein
MASKSNKAPSAPTDARRFLLFLEELGWLLSSYPDVNISSGLKALRGSVMPEEAAQAAVGGYVSSNPNKQFIVGVLPRILMDEVLFPSNEDIAQFSAAVLGVQIPWSGKKSKFDLIGRIVCKTNDLDDDALSRLVQALSVLAERDDRVRKFVKERKEQNFGWNAIIQELALGEQHEQRGK